MKHCRINYKVFTSDDIAIICTAEFRLNDDRWSMREVVSVDNVYLPDRGERFELETWKEQNGERFENMWIYEIRRLLKEDDHDLLWQLNAAAEQQKHEGAC